MRESPDAPPVVHATNAVGWKVYAIDQQPIPAIFHENKEGML